MTFDEIMNKFHIAQKMRDRSEKYKTEIVQIFNDEFVLTEKYNNSKTIQFMLGIYHHTNKRDELAKTHWETAANLNVDIAKKNLVKFYYNEYIDKYIDFIIENNDPTMFYFIGKFYKYRQKNDELAKQYFEMAIEKNNCHKAMYYLGEYCRNENNFDLMEKYWIDSVDRGNIKAMHDLGWYHLSNTKNYELGKKYTNMSSENGCVHSMINLGWFYTQVEKNMDLAKFYYE